MKHSSLVISAVAALLVFGAGCNRSTVLQPPPKQPSAPAETKGFGLLPAISAPGTLGSPEAISARASSVASPIAAPVASMMNAVGEGGAAAGTVAKDAAVGTNAMMVRPEPYPMKAAPVRYDISAALPTWGAEDSVYRVRPARLPTSGIAALATASGLPSQVIGSNPDVRSINVSWKDADGLTWSFDGYGRSLSFWKETDVRTLTEQASDEKRARTIEDTDAIRIADAFLARKGFSSIPHGSAEVEKPWGYGTEPTFAPCPISPMPYLKEAPPEEGAGVAGASGSATVDSKMIVGPCGDWYPQQVTVTYTAQVDTRNVHDAGGWPFRAISIQIDIATKEVTGGNVWLSPETDSSRYPLISSADALKRLKDGGRNPIYPYYAGDDVKEITVRIESASLVWMRYDAWQNNQQQTYFVPALAAEGTVSYTSERSDVYRTVVPLVADDAFGGTDQPTIVPMGAVKVSEPASAPAMMPAPATR